MGNPFRCPECGNILETSFIQQKFDGSCPWCLARIALHDATATPIETGAPFGRYLLADRLGKGGMGEVWKAKDTQLGRWVALKFLREEDPGEIARFQREAQTAAGLSHPGIAAIYEIGEHEGRHYIAMQYVPGLTLASFPKDRRVHLVGLIRDAARAVDHAHRQGIIHRDLKPENFMVEETPEGLRIVVLDFGLARPIEGGTKLSVSGEVVGTAAYMSPEQAQGQKLDPRADVYSLGASLYDLLAGRPPFEGQNILEVIRKACADEPPRLRKLDPKIHRDLETIVLKCLEKDRERRYATSQALADDLERYLNHEPIVARPPSTVYRLKMKLAKRKAVVVATVAVLTLMATAGFVVPTWRAHNDRRLRFERARPHLDTGRSMIHRMKNKMREEYLPPQLNELGEQARGHFRRALEAAPDHPEAHLGIAISWALEKSKEQALTALESAIASDPEFAPAYLERVRLCLDDYEDLRHEIWGTVRPESPEGLAMRKRLDSDLDNAKRYSTEYPRQQYIRGMLAFADGNYEKAVEELSAYLAQETEDGLACTWLGHSLSHLELTENSMRWLDRSISLDKRDQVAYVLRGNAHRKLARTEAAANDYSRALEIKPDYLMAYFNLAAVKLELGDVPRAIELYNSAVVQKDALWSFQGRALTKRVAKDLKGALEECEQALKVNKDFVPAMITSGNIKLEQRDFEGARHFFNRAISLKPDALHAFLGRGQVKLQLGDPPGAIDDFTKAIELNKTFIDAYCNRAVAWLGLDEFQKAIKDCTDAIHLSEQSSRAYNIRGSTRSELGDWDLALQDYERLIELKREEVAGLYGRGTVKRSLGDFGGAAEEFRSSMEKAPPGPQRRLAEDSMADAHALMRATDRRQAYLDAELLYVASTKLLLEKRPAEAREGFEKIAEDLAAGFELGYLAAYRVGVIFAVQGEREKALDWLEKAVQRGFRRRMLLATAPRLASLRSDPRFVALMERIK